MNRIEKLVLEHNMLYQILADPLFWEAVPEFAKFKDEGEAAHFFAFERLMKPREVVPGCWGCTSLRTSIQPILTAMSDDIARWVQEDTSKLDNLISYITKRRGFRPQPIVVYHKDERGVVRPVEF